ncbi:hypothetical protein [Dactylosporangium sp. NPDC050588]|uniref:hypothetical protein n=1 Tax=Dactylosporangium sp. NPDC050588 TaxID=3157211 RepID=UPI0033CDAF4B
MSDWLRFLTEVSWFLEPGQPVTVGEPLPWIRGPVDGLPQLSRLFATATCTPVTVANHTYELLAWGEPDERYGWLGHPPRKVDDAVAPIHNRFWQACGGIVERFGEPSTWWTNQDEVLTAAAAEVCPVEALADYAWIWQDQGLQVPDVEEYYVVAIEANGNLTLAHRRDGRLLLFAPDHAFGGVTPLAGCPPYSLLTIDAAPDLTSWIEVCAAAWQDR